MNSFVMVGLARCHHRRNKESQILKTHSKTNWNSKVYHNCDNQCFFQLKYLKILSVFESQLTLIFDTSFRFLIDKICVECFDKLFVYQQNDSWQNLKFATYLNLLHYKDYFEKKWELHLNSSKIPKICQWDSLTWKSDDLLKSELQK